ncbi:DUF4190 domain-containing protein [Spirilliplanes yamanashiensis]|nr:DUF4190 domain-containing protein [Spirilliplanes yamanashiensis]MDP9814275.1 hypothetical protein [Spirilliplanes yamanashiensis]
MPPQGWTPPPGGVGAPQDPYAVPTGEAGAPAYAQQGQIFTGYDPAKGYAAYEAPQSYPPYAYAPAYPQSGWAQPAAQPYAYPYPPVYGYGYGAPQPRTNGFATASMVTSISALGLMLCSYGLTGVIGVIGAVLGHVARRQIRERGEGGAGMATAGIIMGWIGFGISLLVGGLLVLAITSGAFDDSEPYTT